MNFVEQALPFECDGDALHGILSLPEKASSRGVLIVVGGPQYRVGSHRQFVLLARRLAEAGIPVLRFDYRGMGDSEGDVRSFENVDEDILAAVDQFTAAAPAVREIVIFGLCDAACAALFYAHRDSRVRGLVLINPWVRTSEGLAMTYLKHYYLARLFDRELWLKIASGCFEYRKAAQSLSGMLAAAFTRPTEKTSGSEARRGHGMPLPEKMLEGLRHFDGNVLFILSENDLTANEFQNLVDRSREWKKALATPGIKSLVLPHANHTFSRRDWRENVVQWTREWIASF